MHQKFKKVAKAEKATKGESVIHASSDGPSHRKGFVPLNKDMSQFDVPLDGRYGNAQEFVGVERQWTDYTIREYGALGDIFTRGSYRKDKKFEPKAIAAPDAAATQEEKDIYTHRVKNLWVRYDEEIRTQNRNKPKLYAELYGNCTPAMRIKLEESLEWEKTAKDQNPLTLWTLIKKAALEQKACGEEDANYRYLEADKWFKNVRQLSGEELAVFYYRLLNEIARAEAANIQFYNHAQLKIELEEDAALEAATTGSGRGETQVCADHRQRFLVMVMLSKLDRGQYGGVLKTWKDQVADGYNDVYPRTMAQCLARLNGRAETAQTKVAATRMSYATQAAPAAEQSSKYEKRDLKDIECYYCHEKGHLRSDCEKKKQAARFAKEKAEKEKSGKVAVHVGVTDKRARGTDKKLCVAVKESCDTDKGDAVNYAMCFMMKSEREVYWSSDLENNSQLLDDYDILADNQSNVNVFRNAALLTNIRPAEEPIRVNGIGGSIRVTQVGDFGNFGTVYYHPNALANVLSLWDMVQRYRVTFDNHSPAGNRFVVETDKYVLNFDPKDKLYVHNAKRAIDEGRVVLLQTAASKGQKYSRRELDKAEEARNLFIRMNRPAIKTFKAMLRRGLKGTDVTVKDYERALEVFGPDPGVMKGRMTREKPNPITLELPDRPKRPTVVAIEADIMELEGLYFLICYTRKLKLGIACALVSKAKETLVEAIRGVVNAHHARGFHVNTLLFDGESGISAGRADIESLGVQVVQAAKGEHIGGVERYNRQIKERVRPILKVSTYGMPLKMKRHSVYFTVWTLNREPKDDSKETPSEQFTGEKLNVELDCKFEFGQPVYVYEDKQVKNGMEPRSRFCLYAGPTGMVPGQGYYYDVETDEMVARSQAKPTVLNNEIIKVLNERVEKERITFFTPPHPGDGSGPARGPRGAYKPRTHANRMVNARSNQVEWQNVEMGGLPHYHEVVDMMAVDGAEPQEAIPDQESVAEDAQVEDEDIFGPDSVDDAEEDEDEDEESLVSESEIEVSSESSESEDDDEQFVFDENRRRGTFERRVKPRIFGAKSMLTLQSVQDTLQMFKYGGVMDLSEDDVDYLQGVILTTLTVNKGIGKHGQKALISIFEELNQLIVKGVFKPVRRSDLPADQRRRIMRSLMFLKEKRDGRLKSRACANGSTQRAYVQAGEFASPTVRTESVMISLAIDAAEKREVAVVDIEGAYLIVDMVGDEFVEMDPTLSDLMVELKPEWREFMGPDGKFTLKLVKALYGCVQSARLFYDHLSKSLQMLGFVVNPYDHCVFTCERHGKQVTATIHVDDLKISSVDPRGVDDVIAGLEGVYKKLSIKRGKKLDYLGMDVDFSVEGKVTVGSSKLVRELVERFPDVKVASTPAAPHLFEVDPGGELLPAADAEKFHSTVASMLYMGKHGRPDILLAASFLATRVKGPTADDWKKLERCVGYLKGTVDLVLTLGADDVSQLTFSVDASYGVHVDGKSHSGVFVTLGCGALFAKSVKQKLVSQSSCEAELIALTDGVNLVSWYRHFMEALGYKLKTTVVHQDNQSTKLIAERGVPSQRTRHVNIRYFATKEQIDKGKVSLLYVPTAEMISDFFTKPLSGSLFLKLRNKVMGISPMDPVGAEGVCSVTKFVTKRSKPSAGVSSVAAIAKDYAARVRAGGKKKMVKLAEPPDAKPIGMAGVPTLQA